MDASFSLRLVCKNFHLSVFSRSAIIRGHGIKPGVSAHFVTQQSVIAGIDHNKYKAGDDRSTFRKTA